MLSKCTVSKINVQAPKSLICDSNSLHHDIYVIVINLNFEIKGSGHIKHYHLMSMYA